jgi:hypothetical protein
MVGANDLNVQYREPLIIEQRSVVLGDRLAKFAVKNSIEANLPLPRWSDLMYLIKTAWFGFSAGPTPIP